MREYQIVLSHKKHSETSVVRVHAQNRDDAIDLVGGSDWMVGRVDDITRSIQPAAMWQPDEAFWKQLRATIASGVTGGIVWLIILLFLAMVVIGFFLILFVLNAE